MCANNIVILGPWDRPGVEEAGCLREDAPTREDATGERASYHGQQDRLQLRAAGGESVRGGCASLLANMVTSALMSAVLLPVFVAPKTYVAQRRTLANLCCCVPRVVL